MSKMDDLRAMREARYAALTARAGKPAAARSAPVAPPIDKTAGKTVRKAATRAPAAKATPTEEAGTEGAAASQELCGHRAISGRTCTREQGHAAKSHRYS